MSEKRFQQSDPNVAISEYIKLIWDSKNCYHMNQKEIIDLLNSLYDENEQLKHWNKCLAEKRHNEKESNESLIKKLIDKIDFLERIIDGDV